MSQRFGLAGALLARFDRSRRCNITAAIGGTPDLPRLRTTELAVVDDPTAKRPALPANSRNQRKAPRKPGLNEMGPGVEAIPYRKPGSTMGRPGMRGGFKRKGR